MPLAYLGLGESRRGFFRLVAFVRERLEANPGSLATRLRILLGTYSFNPERRREARRATCETRMSRRADLALPLPFFRPLSPQLKLKTGSTPICARNEVIQASLSTE